MKKIGDLVKLKTRKRKSYWTTNGLIIELLSPRWVKVAWPDGLIQKEHVGDIETISAAKC